MCGPSHHRVEVSYLQQGYLSSMLKTTFMRLKSDALISPSMLSTISLIITALSKIRNTFVGRFRIEVSNFFKFWRIRKERTRLGWS